MVLRPIHNFFVLNGKLEPVSIFSSSNIDGEIYEVLRVQNGIPLFLKEHLQRFSHSAELLAKNIVFTEKEIAAQIFLLTSGNNKKNGNIIIVQGQDFKVFFIPHSYPSKEQYDKGISCGLLFAERQNPKAKVFQNSLRQRANAMITANNYYEVLLVDDKKCITEGSRSNIFFVQGEKLITAKSKKVLSGITRQKVIECIQALNFEWVERDVKLEELSNFDALFLTGTSPQVLPIAQVEELNFDPENSVVKKLMAQFNFLIKNNTKSIQT